MGDRLNTQINILNKVSTMGKQKQAKNSQKSGQQTIKSLKDKKCIDDILGKSVDPKLIEKIITKNRTKRAIYSKKALVSTMMSIAKEDKVKLTKEIKEAFAEIAKAEALKDAERAHPYPKQNKDGVVLNWRTSNAGCRPSCDYVRGLLFKIIRKTKSQAKPKSVNQENKAKPVVKSKMTIPEKLRKKASMQQDSMKSKKSEI